MNNIFQNIDGIRVVVHAAPEGGYWGEVPALPGCVSEGETVEECRANVIEAAQGCIVAQIKWALSHAAFRRPRARRAKALA